MYHIGFQQILNFYVMSIMSMANSYIFLFVFTNFDAIYGLSSSECALEIFRERGRIYGKDKTVGWKFIYMIYSVNLKIKSLLKWILKFCSSSCYQRVIKMRVPNHLERIS